MPASCEALRSTLCGDKNVVESRLDCTAVQLQQQQLSASLLHHYHQQQQRLQIMSGRLAASPCYKSWIISQPPM
ncbi:hypothetical protein LSTR_LSTR004906 [Laodelphax striatellus]|uniref:Uncharacterized protein n=1 Tax=Laodelphax striatellus TaxID=195883 RepID=A0A482XNA6_LAOST|nr:hypothetical protein LSTR_LSTR004906 [Laodelphax striatellus]